MYTKLSLENPKERRHGMSKFICKDNIKMDLGEITYENGDSFGSGYGPVAGYF
jgi:hypothetical protein